jgi:hypothetical protein
VNTSFGSRKMYVPLRGFATVASLFLAFKYSKDLGVINRSYVAIIMTSSILSLTIFTSGTTLTLRNIKLDISNNRLNSSFSALIIIEGILGFTIFNFSLLIFSFLKSPIPNQLIMISSLYYISSFAHLVALESLLAQVKFKLAGKYEFITILLQISLYTFSELISSISIAVRLLLVFTLSYLIVVFLILMRRDLPISVLKPNFEPQLFWNLCKNNHLINTSLGFVDRIDRIMIAWILPTINVGQYSAMSSLVSITRFIPDAVSKILVAGKVSSKYRITRNMALPIGLIILGVLSLIPFSQWLISRLLGPEWLLPWYISGIFLLQELGRGTFQILQNRELRNAQSVTAHNASIILIVFTLVLGAIFALLLKLPGVPLGFAIAYLFAILYLRRNRNE